MAYRKNSEGKSQYYYRPQKSKTEKIQKDWLDEHGYKRDKFPPGFFKNIEKNLTPAKLGYWAYAIDGDGTFSFQSKNRSNYRVAIYLKDREPIQELADIYGTSISRVEFLTECWADVYITRLYGRRALHFLRLICPYMTEKRKKATEFINVFDPDYHPPKISMNFRKNPNLIDPHIGMVAGFFDTEGSVGMNIQHRKRQTKEFGERIDSCLKPWLSFSNTDIRPLRKLKKILETWPFIFKPKLRSSTRKELLKNGKRRKIMYTLTIPVSQHLLFMKMFSPWILITRKKEYADKFERKKKIYEMCKK
jgi:hypothetical protein